MGQIKVYSEVSTNKEELESLGKNRLLSLMKKMLMARRFEEKVEELYLKMALIAGPCHLYLGMEAIAAGVSEALTKDDYVLATYRGHGHAVVRDVPLESIFAELMGRKLGTCKGLGGSMHAATWLKENILLATAIVGSNIPIAAGVGLAIKKRNEKRIVACFFGDGAVNSGAFNEGLNLAAVWKVPVLYVCENNQYAMSLPVAMGTPSSIAERASSYGVNTFVVDGNDPVSVFLAANEARELCLAGEGACFIEAKTYRLKGHGIYDKALYRPEEEVSRWLSKEPIENFRRKLIEAQIMTQEEYNSIESYVGERISDAVSKARASEYLDFASLWSLIYP
jgi:TPP-dependent pyruvate/acetoin dehydrogenase alpha subunit